MKRILLSIGFPLLITMGCQPTEAEEGTWDIQVSVMTERAIDSVFFSNIGQDREFQFIPFGDVLQISLNDSVNDLYNLNFYTPQGSVNNQLWLDGENVVIKGRIHDQLEIDTVIGSPLYYTSLNFSKKFRQMIASGADTAQVNRFLLKAYKENIENPFSLAIAGTYVNRNLSDKRALQALYDLQLEQSGALKEHLLSPYRQLVSIFSTDQIDLQAFSFHDRGGNDTRLETETDKKYLLDFWFMGCAPCIIDHQSLTGKIGLLEENNVELVGISIDRKHEAWQEFLEKKNYPWHNLRENDPPRLSSHLYISGYPTYVVINDQGEILYRTHSLESALEFLEI